jgi:putative heme-binding domain-containing protein
MKFSPVLALLLVPTAFAADPRGDNPDAPPSTPQEQLAKFHVPPGFEVQLVADETQIQKPMNLNFDAAGRLWVTGSELYPWPAKVDALGNPIAAFDKVWASTAGSFDAKKAPPPPERATDTVRILSDFGPDGRARKVEVFADGLNIPVGVQPLPRRPGAKGDSAIVFSIPNIWRMEDTDGDGRADKKEPLYTGFDFRDTHGMSSNYLYWIDGWIYGCHGFRNHSEVRDRNGNVTVFDSGNTYRFRPDGSKIESYTHGQTNPFGLTVDPLGNFYSADSHSKPVYMILRGGYYEGIGKQHDGLGFAPRITDDDHGSSAIAGIAYYAAEQFPEEYRGNLFNGNPVTRRINRDRLEWHGSTPKAIRMPDFLTCDDPWFRPIQVKLGPDGALWIADFYNPIIGHYEFPLADPRRDHQHGRIWRVVWRGEKTDAKREAAALGSTGVPPVAPGVPPGATRVENASPLEKPTQDRRPKVPGETPETTGGTPVLPIATALPDLTQLDAARLVEKLADPNLIVRTLATNEVAAKMEDPANLEKEPLARALEAAWEHNSILESTNSFWILARIEERTAGGTLSAQSIGGILKDGGTPVAAALIRLLADQREIDSELSAAFSSVVAARADQPYLQRALAEYVAKHPSQVGFMLLLRGLEAEKSEEGDVELNYARRAGIRDVLKSPNGFHWALPLTSSAASYQILSEVSLAVPTPESADFLLHHLDSTKSASPRSGEFLRHVVLNLPPEKLGAIAGLVESVKDAPLAQRLSVADNLAKAYKQRGLPLPDAFTDWTQRAMIEALSSGDEAVLKRGVEAVRDVKLEAKLDPLAKVARDAGRDGTLRIAALEAAANLPASRDVLTETLDDPRHMILRKRAAELLAQGGHVDAVLAALPNAPHELALSICGALAKTDAGGATLLGAIEAGKASPRLLLNKAVAGPLNSRPKALQDRAAALTKDLPPEDARLSAVIAERAAEYAKAKPDAEHGAQIFRQSCAACHRFRNEGGNVGPNLDGVAARGAARLLEDILDPNRNVDPLFRQTTIETTDGETLVGANVREQGDTLLLADPTGRDLTIARAKIKKQSQSALSLMPPMFETALPTGDLSDLLGYLLSPTP